MANTDSSSTHWYGLGEAMKELATMGIKIAGVGHRGECKVTDFRDAVRKTSLLLEERLEIRPPRALVELAVYSAIEDIGDAGKVTLYLGQDGSLRAYLLTDVCLGE